MNVRNLVMIKIYMNKKILVLGSNGQLGMSLMKVVRNSANLVNKNNQFFNFGEDLLLSEKDFLFISRKELNLLNLRSISEFIQDQQFTGIVNCAAYTLVEKAETQENLANQINHIAVAKLAEIANYKDLPLIHISTDYVFNGQSEKPYLETDITNPQNIYGLSKLKGERAIKSSGCKGVIIRTSWLYSEFGNNFVKTILRLGKEKDKINVIMDQVGSPTYATNLAKLIFVILNNQKKINILNSQSNIYHYSDEGICSWYELAKSIFLFSKISCKIKPIHTKDYPFNIMRPHYSVMNTEKIKKNIPKLKIPKWRESLKNCLKEIKKQSSVYSEI